MQLTQRQFELKNKETVTQWANAIRRVHFLPQSNLDLYAQLSDLMGEITSYLSAEPFLASSSRSIGAKLYALYGSQPESLNKTHHILTKGLLDCVTENQLNVFYSRWLALWTEINTGFSQQLIQSILAEQEAIYQSHLQAKQRAQLSLQETRQRLRQLMSTTSDAVLLHEDGFIVQANEVATKLLGYPIGALPGMSLFDLFSSEHHELVQNNTGKDQLRIVTALRENGSFLLVEYASRPARYEGSLVNLVVLHPVDINQQNLLDNHVVSPLLSTTLPDSQGEADLLPFQIGNLLQVDLQQRRITYNTQTVPLSKLEFDLFVHLAQHTNVVYSYDDLLDEVWNYEGEGAPRIVQLAAGRLRKKLSKAGADEIVNAIATVRGIGYCFRWEDVTSKFLKLN